VALACRGADRCAGRLRSRRCINVERRVQGVHDDVAARDVCANDAHANVLIGIYFDAGAPNDAGAVTGYDADRPFSADNLRLADLVQADVIATMNARGWGIPDEGVQPDSTLGRRSPVRPSRTATCCSLARRIPDGSTRQAACRAR
jgi:hypothetical protein